MLTLEKRMCGVDSEMLEPSRRAEAIEFQPDGAGPGRTEQPHWVERYWNPLAQAPQSEEELWAFLGNWDL